MGYGDNEPPAIRADAFPATLTQSNQFAMLFLTFVNWDVIKLSWSLENGPPGKIEFDSGKMSTDFIFTPARSDGVYTFTAQGCSKAADGSTNYCSPVSEPYVKVAAHNTNSVTQFLKISGIDLRNPVFLRTVIPNGGTEIRLRTVMGLTNLG